MEAVDAPMNEQMEERHLLDLPEELLQHIVDRIKLAHIIGRLAPACHQLSAAARNVLNKRGFSGEVVTLAGHPSSVAATADGRILACDMVDEYEDDQGYYTDPYLLVSGLAP